MTVSRRAVLAAALAAPFTVARAAQPPSLAPRVVALDWGWAATVVGLGVVPTGVAEIRLYRDWVGAPELPQGVTEVGLRNDPSLETLAALQPDLILTNGLQSAIAPKLETIAATIANPTFSQTRTPLANAEAATRLIGERLSRQAEAMALIDDARARISRARERLRVWRGRALLPFSAIDRRHLMVYGDGSLFVDVLRAVGLEGLWPGATSLWGSRTIAVADLAGLPAGDLLAIAPLPASASAMFDPAGLLMRLCAADRRAVRRLPAAWGFGDVSAAGRFADLLAGALGGEAPA